MTKLYLDTVWPFHSSDWRRYESLTSFFTPSAEWEETDKNLIVKIELPGFKLSEIDLGIEDGVLFIKANNKKSSIKKYYTISNKIKVEESTANLEDGILTITLPKSLESKATKIQIKSN
jgi:HSP20 family protein